MTTAEQSKCYKFMHLCGFSEIVVRVFEPQHFVQRGCIFDISCLRKRTLDGLSSDVFQQTITYFGDSIWRRDWFLNFRKLTAVQNLCLGRVISRSEVRCVASIEPPLHPASPRAAELAPPDDFYYREGQGTIGLIYFGQ